MPLSRLSPLTHSLAPHYPALRAIKKRKTLLESPLYAQIRDELARVLSGVETGEHALATGPRPGTGNERRLRVAAWNIQRGIHFGAVCRTLAHDPVLSRADVLLLVEVDQGMGRSGNRLVARDLAETLGMNYAFGVSYLALQDDFGENPDGAESTLALAGCAILSRLPIRRVENADLPELRDKFSSSEKRLGKKRALVAELSAPGGPLVVCACHLDSNASPLQRARQLGAILDCAESFGVERILAGGDLNTTTYDVSSPLALFRDLAHKLFVTGFRGTVENYMTPDRRYERPVFAELARRGFVVEGYNDRGLGSMVYDFNEPYAVDKVRKNVGGPLTRLLLYKLRPWKGVVGARLDWFAGRGLRPESATVVHPPDEDGVPPSDHRPIVVDLAL